MVYNDDREYLEFLLHNNIIISTEDDYKKHNRLLGKVLNPQDWSSINNSYNTNRVVVIDNFLIEEYCLRLRKFFLYYNKLEDRYGDYAAINFYKQQDRIWFPLLTSITEELKEAAPFLNDLICERGWAFIYDTQSMGVPVHADPASTNVNFWVTPNECMNKLAGHNGLDIWKIYPPGDWPWEDYNRNATRINQFISENEPEKITIDYKFNRVIIFDSLFFHKTNPITCKPGYENRRINYTFLYK